MIDRCNPQRFFYKLKHFCSQLIKCVDVVGLDQWYGGGEIVIGECTTMYVFDGKKSVLVVSHNFA